MSCSRRAAWGIGARTAAVAAVAVPTVRAAAAPGALRGDAPAELASNASPGAVSRHSEPVYALLSGEAAYQNSPDRDLADPIAAYHAENQHRLREVEQAYDRDRFFRYPESIPA